MEPFPRFGKYTVLRTVVAEKKSGKRETFAVCRCDCGSPEKTIALYHLKSGKSKSCGCNRKDTRRTHGLSESPEYSIWKAMRRRCEDPADDAYPYYGARGISVAEEFLDFSIFIKHVGRRPKVTDTLDRINNDGNYAPGNIRWATRTEQMRNTRRNHLLTLDRITMTLSEWCAHLGIKSETLHHRLRRGWSEKRALTEPVKKTTRIYKRKLPCV